MSDITPHLEKARRELEDLDTRLVDINRKREIALVRVQTLEMVAGEDLNDNQRPAPTADRRNSTPAKVTSRGKALGRAAAGSWRTVFANMISQGLDQFSYKDVVQAAKDLAMDAPLPSVRVRVSKFKDQGVLERVSDGVYKPTKKGLDFFQL